MQLWRTQQTKFLYWVIGWVIVGCQCYQISWQLPSGHTDNQLSPNIKNLFGALIQSQLAEKVSHLEPKQ